MPLVNDWLDGVLMVLVVAIWALLTSGSFDQWKWDRRYRAKKPEKIPISEITLGMIGNSLWAIVYNLLLALMAVTFLYGFVSIIRGIALIIWGVIKALLWAIETHIAPLF